MTNYKNGFAVRFAAEGDLSRINELRAQVHEIHAVGKPEIFKPGFPDVLRDYVFEIWNDPKKNIVVAESEEGIVGFAVLNHITRPETPYMYERDYLDIDEFGVDERFRRRGAASAMIAFIREYAVSRDFSRVELNVWGFNDDALAFYEQAGFTTYRRYMEMKL